MLVIEIRGPAMSGKTTTAKRLEKMFFKQGKNVCMVVSEGRGSAKWKRSMESIAENLGADVMIMEMG